MVPLRSATTLRSPALISDCAPMMLRVRQAQFTTISVPGRASAPARSTSSAPGTLVAVGMLIVWYSSNRRASSTTASRPSRALSSAGPTAGVPAHASTSSPNALLGALTSRNSSPSHPARPPASADTSG